MALILVSPPPFLACGQCQLKEHSGMLITRDPGELQSRMFSSMKEKQELQHILKQK